MNKFKTLQEHERQKTLNDQFRSELNNHKTFTKEIREYPPGQSADNLQ
jgi:maltodextrin utilization protein YvdJ